MLMFVAGAIGGITGFMAVTIGATFAVSNFLHAGEFVGKAPPALGTPQIRK